MKPKKEISNQNNETETKTETKNKTKNEKDTENETGNEITNQNNETENKNDANDDDANRQLVISCEMDAKYGPRSSTYGLCLRKPREFWKSAKNDHLFSQCFNSFHNIAETKINLRNFLVVSTKLWNEKIVSAKLQKVKIVSAISQCPPYLVSAKIVSDKIVSAKIVSNKIVSKNFRQFPPNGGNKNSFHNFLTVSAKLYFFEFFPGLPGALLTDIQTLVCYSMQPSSVICNELYPFSPQGYLPRQGWRVYRDI